MSNEAGLLTHDHVRGDHLNCLLLLFRRSWLRPNAIGSAQGAELNFRVQLRSGFAEILVADCDGPEVRPSVTAVSVDITIVMYSCCKVVLRSPRRKLSLSVQ